MQFLKPIICVLLSFAILALSGGMVQAKNDKGKMKYRGMDRNNNGVITREEWRGNDKSFRNHDWNGDGVLSGDEVIPGAHRYQGAQPSSYSNLFSELDYNNDSFVSRSEWNNTTRSFDYLDLNRDGRLNRDEFYNRQQYPVSIFRELDQNNDGRIAYSEWRSTSVSFDRLDINKDRLLSESEFNTPQNVSLVEQVFQEIFGRR